MAYCYEKAIPHSEYLGWDAEDRAKLVAFALEKAETCDLCGTAGWEWKDNRFAYTAVEDFCQGCYQKAVYQETQTKGLPGTNIKLVPTTPQLKAQMLVTSRRRERMMRSEETDG